jgi:hypothetical protein
MAALDYPEPELPEDPMRTLHLAATLATLLLVPATVQAAECLKTVYHGSNAALLTGRYQDMAKDNAVLSWGTRVTTSVGPNFANWNNAVDKRFSCVMQGRLHKCTASARPCLGN